MDQILRVFGKDQIRLLDKMFMCGNYGDPAAGYHTLDIYHAFRQINPVITLGMNSNGGLQNTAWWCELAAIMNRSQDYVVFSIDGLEDTNSIYRVNVNWSKVMANAQAFIAAGGFAHWDMLVYRHNQHQVDQAQALAQEMGFTWFRAKVSKRQSVKGLNYPVGWQQPHVESGTIDCHALREKSAYIDAQGRVHPCCWLGDQIDRPPVDFAVIQQSWLTNNPEPVCQRTCASQDSGTSFTNQWQRNVALK
jgi:MoaA/NifB/PqqE/SkfB family radical SAM enzyme